MTDYELKSAIQAAVKEMIYELKKSGLIKDSDGVLYNDAIEIITGYYEDGQKDAAIKYAIYGLRFDPYYQIIPLYFEQHETLEKIAEKLGVTASTIVRNKKRLCLAIYNEII